MYPVVFESGSALAQTVIDTVFGCGLMKKRLRDPGRDVSIATGALAAIRIKRAFPPTPVGLPPSGGIVIVSVNLDGSRLGDRLSVLVQTACRADGLSGRFSPPEPRKQVQDHDGRSRRLYGLARPCRNWRRRGLDQG
jgi:hypothetical protein